ncbi:hypothetical protein H5410_053900 [Solanum commersonii]|uniref:DUF4283 domain-containing protein n=1 Tax=Solanum commersonii TaxID=4109 RepID=A0A9J5X4Q4_SOLCO|nr:hypothetical protein H5410_053900 [Solanum commersonii]
MDVVSKGKEKAGEKTWVNLFARNRASENGMTLSYIPPQMIEGKLEKEEVDRETQKWRSGPYTLNYKPIVLKAWTASFNFEEEFPTEIPLWVKFPKLPLNCWSGNSLSRIASQAGTPIYADECTAKQTRISFARMLIEVNLTKPLPHDIAVMDPNGRVFTQAVEYDWKSLFYDKCQTIGHVSPLEPRKIEANGQPSKGRAPAKKDDHVVAIKGSSSSKQAKIDREAARIGPAALEVEVENINTPIRGNGLSSNTEFNLANFPALSPTTTKCRNNPSATVRKGGRPEASMPPDRVKQHRASRVMNNIVPGWGHMNKYHSASDGRIWIIWDTNSYGVKKIRLIDFECMLTVIYGYNTGEQRKPLWNALKALGPGNNIPWIISGDFNALLNTQDRISGAPVQYAEIKDFSRCMENLLLNELTWKGIYYTWTNIQQRADRVCSQLDRTFGNHEWMMKWGHAVVEYELPSISDHAPMLMNVKNTHRAIKVPFRFFQHMGRSCTIPRSIRGVWSTGTENGNLNNEAFRNAGQEVEKVSANCSNTIQIASKNKRNMLYKIWKNGPQLKKIYLDRSSEPNESNWEILTIGGAKLVTQESIQEEILSFYKSLMGSTNASLPSINRLIMKTGPTLTQQQHKNLCAMVNDNEIEDSLKAIGDDKAPGNDGFNAMFFKSAWPRIKLQIIGVVKDFFITGKLYRLINCTSVTFVLRQHTLLVSRNIAL